jgi:hypothetical protein
MFLHPYELDRIVSDASQETHRPFEVAMTRFVSAWFVVRETLASRLDSHLNAPGLWVYNPRSRSGGLVIVILAIPVFLASDPEGRRIVGVLQRATATTPKSAMNAHELDADDSRTLRRLIKEGTIGETSDRRYFVNLSAVARFRRKRILTASGVALLIGAAVLVAIRPFAL